MTRDRERIVQRILGSKEGFYKVSYTPLRDDGTIDSTNKYPEAEWVPKDTVPKHIVDVWNDFIKSRAQSERMRALYLDGSAPTKVIERVVYTAGPETTPRNESPQDTPTPVGAEQPQHIPEERREDTAETETDADTESLQSMRESIENLKSELEKQAETIAVLTQERDKAKRSAENAKEQATLLKELYETASNTVSETTTKLREVQQENQRIKTALDEGLAAQRAFTERIMITKDEQILHLKQQYAVLVAQSHNTNAQIRNYAALWQAHAEREAMAMRERQQRIAFYEAQKHATAQQLPAPQQTESKTTPTPTITEPVTIQDELAELAAEAQEANDTVGDLPRRARRVQSASVPPAQSPNPSAEQQSENNNAHESDSALSVKRIVNADDTPGAANIVPRPSVKRARHASDASETQP
ncbi:hypothetical protein MCUN1_001021 [Malassezia cuniculi]|uniref:Uncharacterized protein n=1 Tax=Malassezia cuniculi TaxID=948313 RepID=A0AAF0J663_9BASI|nr:hypothetical protein MCUN1_001021 [Malassezia cuniculi]